MKDLIDLIDALLIRVASTAVTKESVEWYLTNNLNDYKAALTGAASSRDIENATRALNRFCTESMDWDNPLYRACCEITERGMKLGKDLR